MGKRYIKRLEYMLMGFAVIMMGLLVYIADEHHLLKQTTLEKVRYDDFPSSERGRLSAVVAPTYYNIEPWVVLFSSGSVPGVALIYYPERKTLLAGSPFMQAQISLFDGLPHTLEYVFADGKQQLYYDQDLVAFGVFRKPEGSTGMVEGRQVSEKLEKVEME